MKKALVAGALALALSWVVSSAQAATSSVATSNLSFAVVDLTPLDGHDAGYRFDTSSPYPPVTSVSAQIDNYHDGIIHGVLNNKSFAWFHPDTWALAVPHAGTHATVGPGSVSMNGESFIDGLSYQMYVLVYGQGIWVAPHTQMTINWTASVQAAAANVCGELVEEHRCDWASALASMSVHSTSTYEDYVDSISVAAGNEYGDRHAEDSRVLSITFSNFTDSEQLYGLGFYNTLEGGKTYLGVPTVPEPSAFALCLTGLAVVGAAARRRRGLKALGRTMLALSLSLGFCSVQAADSTARMSNLGFDVVDLTPLDGRTAGFRFADRGYAYTSVSAFIEDEYFGRVEGRLSTTSYKWFDAGSYPLLLSNASASTTVWSDGFETAGETSLGGIEYAGWATMYTERIMVAPHTQLTVHMWASASATADDICGNWFDDVCDWAGAHAGMNVYTEGMGYLVDSFAIAAGHDHGVLHAENSRLLSLTFSNLTDAEVRYSLALYAGVQGEKGFVYTPIPTVPSVPEPSTLALCLAGLAGMAAVARRRHG